MTEQEQQSLAAIKQALAKAMNPPEGALGKAYVQSGSATSGFTYYDLEPGAKDLFPVLTPLRNQIPRVSGKGGIQANWRAITGINTGGISAGVAQGNRGGVIATAIQDYVAVYKGLGLEDSVTFEAQYAAQGFDDARGAAAMNTLKALMIQEEKIILGGNNSLAFGTTPTPTLVASASGGSLATQTLSVIAVALSLEGYLNASVAGGIAAQVSRTNADGSSDNFGGGSAQKSTNATVSVTGPNGSVAASVAVVRGAVGYAWFWGTAGSEKLGAITTINSVSITAVAAGTQTAASLPASDNSTNALVFDGLLSQIAKAGSNAYFANLATGTAGTGTPLTSDNAGGIVEIDTALQSFWDNYRLGPTDIYVSSQEMANIGKKVLAGNANAAQRFTFTVNQGVIAGGTMVRSYLNKFSLNGAQEIPIRLHPNLPAGTILFCSSAVPYPLSGVANVLRILARQDYYQIEWPLKTRKYEYGVYVDEVLQNYFPPAFGMISNIGNG